MTPSMVLSSLLSSSTNSSLKSWPPLSLLYFPHLIWPPNSIFSHLSSTDQQWLFLNLHPQFWPCICLPLPSGQPLRHLNFSLFKTNFHHLPKPTLPIGFPTLPMPQNQSFNGNLEFHHCSVFRAKPLLRIHPVTSSMLALWPLPVTLFLSITTSYPDGYSPS